MKKLANLLGLAAIISLAVSPSLAQQSAAVPLHHRGRPTPAPEIGIGILGVLLGAAAVKYSRQRSRGRDPK